MSLQYWEKCRASHKKHIDLILVAILSGLQKMTLVVEICIF